MADGVSLEQTVLGHAINDPKCFEQFASEITHHDFGAPNHKAIAFCLCEMYERGVTLPDEDTFQLVIDGWSGDKDYGGVEYIRLLKKGYALPTLNYKCMLGDLKLQGVKGALGGKYLENLLKALNNPTTSAADVKFRLEVMSQLLEQVSDNGTALVSAQQMSELYIEELDKRISRKFATTGISTLDTYLTEGFLPTKVTTMAGFTGMGKSTLGVTMAHRIAVAGHCVCFFSMETQSVGVWDKIVSSLTQIPLVRLKKDVASLTTEERGRIDKALSDLNRLPLLINDRVKMSMSDMRYHITNARRTGYDPRVVFVDLFGKLEDVEGDNKASKIETEMKYLRVLAQDLNVHFVAIVQIGRQGFGRDRQGRIRRPLLVDIKNANAYAEEADIVLLLHRNSYYLPDLDDDILEVNIAKQREGEVTSCYLEMFADRATIMNTLKRPHDMGG